MDNPILLNLNPDKLPFQGTCVENPFDSVEKLSEIIDNAEEITKSIFLKYADVDEEIKKQMKRFPRDYGYFKYQKNKEEIYFYTWSMIEHFYYKYKNNPIFLNLNPKLSIETLVKKVGKGGNVAIVSGSRGSGKTAASWYLVEKMHQDLDKKIYVIGVPVSLSKHLPKYVNIVDKIEDVPNDCVVFIDEAGIQFASRMWRKDNHAYLSDVFHIARHKNISLIFVSLSSALVDVNIIRLADTLIFKRPSLLQFKLERRQIKSMYEKVLEAFKKTKKPLRLTYIFDSDFEGSVELPLPSFWCEEISKSYKYFTIGKGLEGMNEIEEGTMGYVDSITYHCSCHGDVGLCVKNGGDYYNHEFKDNKPMLKRIEDKFHIVGRVRVTGSGIEDYDGEENSFRVVDLPKEIKKIGILKEITVKGEPLVVSSAVLATDKDGKWLFILEEGERGIEKNPKKKPEIILGIEDDLKSAKLLLLNFKKTKKEESWSMASKIISDIEYDWYYGDASHYRKMYPDIEKQIEKIRDLIGKTLVEVGKARGG